jgi:putative membrane protein
MASKEDLPNAPAKDRGTQLAEQRTSLALNRNFLASERTLMAWMRTALSMISFGFTMIKFFQFLESSRGPTVGLFGRTWTPEAIGFSMMTIGTLSLGVAVLHHRRQLKVLREAGLESSNWSLAFVVSALVVLLGFFALVSLLLGH